MNRGCFVVSLDTELAWGWIDRPEVGDLYPLWERTRNAVDGLLRLFERYRIPATWAFVGRLLERKAGWGSTAESSARGSRLDRRALYRDPAVNSPENSYLCGPDLLEAVLASPVAHEVGSHSYDHVVFGDPSCSRAMARDDLRAFVSVSREWGIAPHSFVYPRNSIGHRDVLAEMGFRTYRGPDVSWFDRWPRPIRRVLRRIDLLCALPPGVSTPAIDRHGLVRIPGHLFFRIPHRGLERHFPPARLVAKAKKGIRRAAEAGAVFHLWFHPFNFGHRTEQHLAALEDVLAFAAAQRDAGALDTLTLGGCAELWRERLSVVAA